MAGPPSGNASRVSWLLPPLAAVTGVVIVASWAFVAGTGQEVSALPMAAAPAGWSKLPASGLTPRMNPAVVRGPETYVIGGTAIGGDGAEEPRELADGAAYNAISGTWRSLPATPSPAPLGVRTGVWVQDRVVLLGAACKAYSDFGCVGGDLFAAEYEPSRNVWTAVAPPTGVDISSWDAVPPTGLGASNGNAYFALGRAGEVWSYQLQGGAWRKLPQPADATTPACILRYQWPTRTAAVQL